MADVSERIAAIVRDNLSSAEWVDKQMVVTFEKSVLETAIATALAEQRGAIIENLQSVSQQIALRLYHLGFLDEEVFVSDDLFTAGVSSQIQSVMNAACRDKIGPAIAVELAAAI